MRYRLLVILPLLWGIAATSGDLASRLDALHDDPFLGRAILGSKVVRVDSGVPLHERNADKLLVPASTVKLITTVALMRQLPLDHVVETPLAVRGTLRDGLLQGDVVLVGAGDPSLTSEDIGRLADRLVDDGLRRVQGDVVGDDRLFSARALGRGWMWDDLPFRYSPPISALSVDGNTVVVELRGTEPGQLAEVLGHPCLPLETELQTGPADEPAELEIVRLPGRPETVVQGIVPEGEVIRRTLSIPEPAACAAHHLNQALAARGVEVDGVVRAETPDAPYAGLQRVSGHRSPPLRDLLRHMLVVSDNLYAEALARWLDPAERGRDYEGAFPAIRGTMVAAGVPDDGWRLVDGSGLSRYNRLTPEALVRVLRFAWQQPWGDDLLDLLPVSGEGTLRTRLVGGPAQDQVTAKSGSMTGVINLTGYLVAEDGEPLAFALLTNGVAQPGSAVRYTQDTVLHLLASAPSPPPPAGRGCHRR